MANYTSKYTGAQIDEAVGKALDLVIDTMITEDGENLVVAKAIYAALAEKFGSGDVIPVANGGTGASTAAAALTNIGAAAGSHTHSGYASSSHTHSGYASSSHTHSASDITSGTLPVSYGGTGKTTLTSGYFLRGNGTSAVSLSSAANARSAMGLGNSTGALSTSYGGTGQSSVYSTLSFTKSSMTSSSTFTGRYFPYQGLVFIYLTATNASVINGGTAYTMGTISSSYAPNVERAYLACNIQGGQAWVDTAGSIRIYSPQTGYNPGTRLYASGCYVVT